MIRRLLFLILVAIAASTALAQQRYTATLQFDADDDPATITRQLAATYRLQIDPADVGRSTITVTATGPAIGMLRTDRRVVSVDAARPTVVETNADGFGTYDYDGAGNITQVGDDTFVYDTRGRIDTATISGIAQTFTYDTWGNITKIVTDNESDRTIAVSPNNRLSGASYDGSGNLTSYHGGTFVYDALNVVKESTPTGGNRHLYLHSASNERIATIELVGAQQQSEWTVRDDAGKVLRRFNKSLTGAWTWEEDYVYRGTLLLAAEVPSPEKVRHFHLDHLGTPRLITGNGGAVIARRSYGAFGRGLDVESTPAPNEAAQFTGHERDSFQLDYMHARYYDPMMGRFLAVDPTWESADLQQPQSWNRYSYVLNNPIYNTDPDGRCGVPKACPEPPPREELDAMLAQQLLPALPSAETPLVLDPFSRPLETLANTLLITTLINPFVGDEVVGAAASTTTRGTVGAVGEGAAARSSVQANKAAGDAFRDQIAAGLRAEGRQVTTEVVKKTPFGPRRVDIEVADASGRVLGGVETKVGRSRYTPSQRAKDTWLKLVRDYIVNLVRDN